MGNFSVDVGCVGRLLPIPFINPSIKQTASTKQPAINQKQPRNTPIAMKNKNPLPSADTRRTHHSAAAAEKAQDLPRRVVSDTSYGR